MAEGATSVYQDILISQVQDVEVPYSTLFR